MLLRKSGLDFRSANPAFMNTNLIQRLANPFLFKRWANFSVTGSLIRFVNPAPDTLLFHQCCSKIKPCIKITQVIAIDNVDMLYMMCHTHTLKNSLKFSHCLPKMFSVGSIRTLPESTIYMQWCIMIKVKWYKWCFLSQTTNVNNKATRAGIH